MKSKAFTLIEMMAVVIILAAIAVLAAPAILKQINATKGELSDSMKEIIYSAGGLYASNKNLVKTDGYTYCVTIQTLVDGEYLNSNLIDPVTKENIDKNNYVKMSVFNSSFEYEVVDICSQYTGPNEPELYTNMIPVKWDNFKASWVYADRNSKWYDYDNKLWANAVVLVTSPSQTYAVGDSILMSDIAQMYVWIPRYKYTIFNGNNGSVPAQEINVTFESGTRSTGTVTCTDNIASGSAKSEDCTDTTNSTVTNGISTYTHPAFTFGSTELTGIWVGKFENSNITSCTPVTGSIDTGCDLITLGIQIKPNVTSWRGARVSTYYTAISNVKSTYGLTNADSHMIKNMEWGAAAYLKQSKYGLGVNDIGINNNNTYTTGCGASTGSAAVATCDAYNSTNGVLASTTGNIYGIYDMSGGAWEYVMGNTATSVTSPIVGNASNNSGFAGIYYDGATATGRTFPNIKYANLYSYDASSNVSHGRGKLGDATKETLITFGNTGGGWYSDYAVFPFSYYPWFVRGGYYNSGSVAGMFSFGSAYGYAYINYVSRSVITAQ